MTRGHRSWSHYRAHHHCDHYFSARVNQLIVLRLNTRSPRTFHGPACPIHAYAALGPRFLAHGLDRALNPVRTFPYTPGTRPQPRAPFIRGFVSRFSSDILAIATLWTPGISGPKARPIGPFCRLYRTSHGRAFALRRTSELRGRASGRYSLVPRLGHAVRQACRLTVRLMIFIEQPFVRCQHFFSSRHSS